MNPRANASCNDDRNDAVAAAVVGIDVDAGADARLRMVVASLLHDQEMLTVAEHVQRLDANEEPWQRSSD